MNVFISGSRAIHQFDKNIVNALYDELNANAKILVGDADGVDVEVQRFCDAEQYRNVVVYATNGRVRNNAGGFPVQDVFVDNKVYYRDFFTQKDIVMTGQADYGIVIWDGKSKGSLNNIKRLIQQNKPCFIYHVLIARWFEAEDENELKRIAALAVSTDKQNSYTQLSFL